MDLKALAAPTAGIALNLGDLDIGVSYRGSVWSELNIDVPTSADVALGQTIPLMVKLVVFDYYTPETMSVGVGYRLGALRLSADYELQKWSGMKVSSAKKTYYQGLGVAVPEFDDIWVPKVGVSFDVTKTISVMAGYYHQPTFVPDDANKTYFNFLDNDKDVFSLGLAVLLPKLEAMSCPVQINVGYQYQDLKDREVVKTNNNTYGPNYTYGGKVNSFVGEVIVRW
ncbi:MAG: hypothetical protein PHY31_09860 [Smithellaceae bacterium]|nr:hypothetical protein [Smithellaceae bacterium]